MVKDIRIKELYVYPLKSCLPIPVQEAEVALYGFKHDRTYMFQVIKTEDDWRNVRMDRDPEFSLLKPTIDEDSELIRVTHVHSHEVIDLPLYPDYEDLPTTEVDMYSSKMDAYIMPDSYNEWFTTQLGFKTRLLYQGDHEREVLGKTVNPMTGIKRTWRDVLSGNKFTEENSKLAFNCCAHYLLLNDASLDVIRQKAAENGNIKKDDTFGVETETIGSYETSKLRPSIVVDGDLEPWEEDLWARVKIEGTEIYFTANCGRCRSLDIDYTTGKFVDSKNAVLKHLYGGRRIDKGYKFSPICGRYGFSKDIGNVIKVGQSMEVLLTNEAPTQFDWPLGIAR
ncbi:hypothetical protein CANCADRAFT_109880 [Tortispora caseinolytica NRRL Y-17796]|uniref:MOSC domain-containing protein n=1 Tax=Tortispora caseinolytica NRRL Y-17796 TaxID=767744 RepID=A0A1E4TGA6_9ASCO|nr:hypothetical protein CANCADRAFT_109880 [Tortispora caseinolytica NRRL Y-17796]